MRRAFAAASASPDADGVPGGVHDATGARFITVVQDIHATRHGRAPSSSPSARPRGMLSVMVYHGVASGRRGAFVSSRSAPVLPTSSAARLVPAPAMPARPSASSVDATPAAARSNA